jgi:hypothetical protein
MGGVVARGRDACGSDEGTVEQRRPELSLREVRCLIVCVLSEVEICVCVVAPACRKYCK